MIRAEPVTLAGAQVRLEPLGAEHLPAPWVVARDAELWRWSWSAVRTPDPMRRYVEEAPRQQAAAGTALPFATVGAAAGRVVGSTRSGSLAPAHRRAWRSAGRGSPAPGSAPP